MSLVAVLTIAVGILHCCHDAILIACPGSRDDLTCGSHDVLRPLLRVSYPAFCPELLDLGKRGHQSRCVVSRRCKITALSTRFKVFVGGGRVLARL